MSLFKKRKKERKKKEASGVSKRTDPIPNLFSFRLVSVTSKRMLLKLSSSPITPAKRAWLDPEDEVREIDGVVLE
jgi:hypothetical protein